MSPRALRRDLIDALALDREAFDRRLDALVDRHDLGDDVRERLVTAGESFDGPPGLSVDDLEPTAREYVRRLWALDRIPLGLVLSGPAYRDNPILHANRTFRELTGYSPPTLRGENPRLLQGPDAEGDAVADLAEAVAIWEPVTVELTNRRRDGTPFRNRVSLVPIEGTDGGVANWVGIQAAVGDE